MQIGEAAWEYEYVGEQGGRHHVRVPDDLLRDVAGLLERLAKDRPAGPFTLERMAILALTAVMAVTGVLLTRVLDQVDQNTDDIVAVRVEAASHPTRVDMEKIAGGACGNMRDTLQVQIDGISDRERMLATVLDGLRGSSEMRSIMPPRRQQHKSPQ